MDKPNKSRKMVEYLEQRILSGQFESGSKLPSARQLCDQFSLSYGAVQRGVDYLHSQGLVDKQARRGIYVKGYSSGGVAVQSGRRKIAVFGNAMQRSPDGLFACAFSAIQGEAFSRDCTVISNNLEIGEASPMVMKRLAGDADGIIMLHEYDSIMRRFDLSVPSVGVLMHETYSGRVSVVDIDPFDSAEQALDYFTEHGFRKTAAIIDWRLTYRKRAEIFRNLCNERGVECEILDRQQQLEFRKDTAYLFTSDNVLQFFSEEYLNEHGRYLADDFCVLGIDGKSRLDPVFHEFPSICINWHLIGKIALRECLERVENPGTPARRIYVCGHLRFPEKN